VVQRQQILDHFRERLAELVLESGGSKVALARALEIDRTTLTQLLSTANRRLPRTETLVALARHANVSVDWLLGLRHDDPGRTQMMNQPALEHDVRSHDDERLIAWLTEAKGMKVRYVPSSLPDLMKSDEVIRFESAADNAGPERKIETAEARLRWQRRPEADMECCSSIQSLVGFARGEGIWRDLASRHRREQLERISLLSHELYPTFRWFLYDGRERYGAPVTVFGTRRAALYVGRMFLVFTTDEHVQAMSQNFDSLIRAAVVQPPDIPKFCRQLLAQTNA
jgi:transcriptional regulator with XRE-family HTH domain